jgi:hypothetical protein
MKRRRHTPDQIVRKAEGDKLLGTGQTIDEACRSLEIADSTWQRCSNRYGCVKADDAKRPKELEEENTHPKCIVVDQAFDIDMLKEVNRKTSNPRPPPTSSGAPRGTVRGLRAESMHGRCLRNGC